MNTLLIDDHLLLRVLLGGTPAELASEGSRLATTGLWYHRLCRAISDSTVVGSLSRRLGDVPEAVASKAASAVAELPQDIDLLSMRMLAWPMADLLNRGARLNLLGLEALAAASQLEAKICMDEANVNVPLQEAAVRLGVPARIVG